MKTKTKYIKQANYRLVMHYPDGQIWDVPAFNPTGFSNHFWGTEEEWDAIPDGTEIFPPQREPQITEQSSRIEIMDFGLKNDPVVDQVIDGYRQRSAKGISKYGTTLEKNNTDDFLQHLQEELMDAVLYIQKLKSQNGK